MLEHGKHRRVACEYVGFEGRQASVLSDACEMPQQDGCDAASPVRLCDYEGQLGTSRLRPFVCGVAAIADNNLLAVCSRYCRHQGDDLPEIHIGNPLEFGVRQRLLRTEEAAVDRLTIEGLERVKDPLLVVFPDCGW
jgi:hypothetical protein